MIVVEACERVHGEVVVGIQRSVETTTNVGTPVTIDVFRLCNSYTSTLIVTGTVGCAVISHIHTTPSKDTSLMCHLEGVKVEVDVVTERRFQSRISLCDVQRVGIISDIKQIGHAWLRSTSSVVQTQIRLLSEVVAEVNIGSKVEHITCNLWILISHVFVVEHTSLWQEVKTEV